MLRPVALALAIVGALVGAVSASGHSVPAQEGFRSTVSSIEPPVPGLVFGVLDGGKLTVRNWSGKTVLVNGGDGRPLYRFDDNGVHRREGRRWVLLERGTSYGWHDARVHWSGSVPGGSGLVSRFRVTGAADGTPFAVRGYIGYRSPDPESTGGPRPWAAIAVGGLALGLAALAFPLLRREGEGRGGQSATESASGRSPRRM